MKAAPPGRAILSKPRSRRDASKALALALSVRYRKLLQATGEDEIVVATADLAQCMYENIEFIIWGLKSIGGMNPPPPEELRKITPPNPANDPRRFAKPPVFELDAPASTEEREHVPLDICECPPLEAGIIGRERHMTSCPKFVP